MKPLHRFILQLRAHCLCAVALSLALPAGSLAADPVPSGARGALSAEAARDEATPVTQAQLQSIGLLAAAALETLLPGGAGPAIAAFVERWRASATAADAATVVTLGQLKSTAQPFYDRLIESGIAEQYPWNGIARWSDDQAPATLGHLRAVFAFALVDENSALLPSTPSGTTAGGGAEGKSQKSDASSQKSELPVASSGAAAAGKATAPAIPSAKPPAPSAGAVKITIDYPAPGEKL